jgi:hypothetical protein
VRNAIAARRRVGRTEVGSIEVLEPRAYFSVDLSGSISFVSPASRQVKPGQSFSVAVEVFNNGDTTAGGKLAINLGISTNADGLSPISEGTITKEIHIAAGGHTIVKLSKKVPVGFTPAAYYGVADIDPGDTFSETNLANNSAVSAAPLTVLSPYPNLIGTWSGTGVVKKGDDKGLIFSHVDIFTSESDTTGAFTYTGTNTFPNGVVSHFSGTGAVTTKGVITDQAESVPASDTGVDHGKGKVTGNKISVTFANALSSGTESLTREG